MKALILAALLLLTLIAIVPASDARPPVPDCMPVYSRTDIETIAIVRPNSCTVRVYTCPYQGAPISECDPLIG